MGTLLKASALRATCGLLIGLALLGLFEWARLPGAFASEPVSSGYPWDWSHEHIIFSKPSDPRALARIQQDPRFLHQWLKRSPPSILANTNTNGSRGSLSDLLESHDDHGAGAPPLSAWQANASSIPLAAWLQPHRPEFLPGVKPFVLVLLAVLAVPALSLPVAFRIRRFWSPSLITFLIPAVFLILASCGETGTPTPGPIDTPPAPQTLTRDWGATIGSGSKITQTNANNAPPMYPAKYTFNVNSSPSCTNDYVVFPTGANGTNTGGNPTPSILAFNELYSSQAGGVPAGYCSTTGPTVAWAYLNVTCATSTTMSNDPISSSPVISLDGKKAAWVTSAGKVQILTIGTVGSNGSSATNPVCIENAPGGTATTPNNAVLNSITLTNAKQNGNPAKVSLSEIFVDYNSDSAYVGDDDGYLHKITPFFNATAALQEVTTAEWLPSHIFSIGSLIIDNNGFVEECTHAGVSGSGGHPGWSTTWGGATSDNTVTWTNQGSGGGWPVYVTGVSNHTDNSQLSGPVFDFVSKNIFIGDQHGSLFYVLDPGIATPVGSCANGATLYPCLGAPGTASTIAHGGGPQQDCATATPNATCMVMSNQHGFTDSVSVDSANSLVITQFSNADNTNAAVEQTNTSLSVFHSATLAGKANLSYHAGDFDNTYFSTPANGYYYVCGPDSTGHMTDLYRVGFTNTSGTIALGSTNGTPFQLTTNNNSADCSPITEIYNTATSVDWLFLSVDNHGVTTTCNNQSCVMSFALGSPMVSAVNASYAGPGNLNGTSAIIVDNVANTTTFPQASSIYFAPVANNLSCGDGSTNTTCGIKLTQSALQ